MLLMLGLLHCSCAPLVPSHPRTTATWLLPLCERAPVSAVSVVMCFNIPMSAAIGLAAIGAAGLLAKRGKPFRFYCMFLYFGVMEFIQIAQYLVADQCDNKINQALTWAAFAHVAFQPLMVNIYFLYGQRNPHPEIGSFVVKLCVAAAVLMLMRTPFLPITLLGDALHKYIPDLPTSDTYGKHCHYLEAFCGPRTCSFKGGAWGHISWSLPLAPATYFVPGAFLHFFLFFIPTLIAGDAVKKLLMAVTIFIGPLWCMVFAAQDMSSYPYEWATIWCFFAALQSFSAVIIELFFYPRGYRAAAPSVMQSVGRWVPADPPSKAGELKEPLIAAAEKKKKMSNGTS